MIDLKLKKKQSTAIPEEAINSREEYPYGLRITLDDSVIKKLGLNLKGVNIGQKVKLSGIAAVVEISEYENRKSLRLQIQQIEMPMAKTKPRRDNTLIVNPSIGKKIKAPTNETGIARVGIKVALQS